MFWKKEKLVNYFYAGVDRDGKRFEGLIHDTDVKPKALMESILRDTGGNLTAFNQI